MNCKWLENSQMTCWPHEKLSNDLQTTWKVVRWQQITWIVVKWIASDLKSCQMTCQEDEKCLNELQRVWKIFKWPPKIMKNCQITLKSGQMTFKPYEMSNLVIKLQITCEMFQLYGEKSYPLACNRLKMHHHMIKWL